MTERREKDTGVGSLAGADVEALEPAEHTLRVLELDRVREILTSYAASPLGKALAARVEPIRKRSVLESLHQESRELGELASSERIPLAGLSDVCGDLRRGRAQGRPAEPELLWRVVELLRAGASLRVLFGRHRERFPALAELGDGIEDLPDLREEIPRSVDARDGVRSEASEKLAAVRREIAALREQLRGRAQDILQRASLRRCFQSEGITLRDDRYVLAVKGEYRAQLRGRVRDRSQSGSTVYIEPDEMLRDGDRLVRLLDEERDETTVILWELTRRVKESHEALRRIQSRLARIDLTWAKASWARAFGLTTPRIVDDGGLELSDARHPYLLWLARDTRRDIREVDPDEARARVVPLSVRLDDHGCLLIVTGPNTGGKTVALKTIGLNVLLALCGLPVAAAEGAKVPIYSSIFVDIGDEQSLEQSLSTFSSHLRRIVEVLRHADERSLILLDELGSGTDPLEGAALGRALLDHFRERGWTAIITTHLGSLKEYAYLHEGVDNAAMEFDTATLRPTYRLLLGVPGSSNALAIASRLGVDESIVEAARREIEGAAEPTREIISRMEQSRRRVEKERRRVERVRRAAQGERREYEERRSEVEARKEMLDCEADLEVDRVIRAARERLMTLLDRLKSVPQAHRPVVDELIATVDELLVATPLGERREAFARSLKKGDELWVLRFRARATVRKINKGDRVVTVLMDGIPVEVGFDDISWIEGAGRQAEDG